MGSRVRIEGSWVHHGGRLYVGVSPESVEWDISQIGSSLPCLSCSCGVALCATSPRGNSFAEDVEPQQGSERFESRQTW